MKAKARLRRFWRHNKKMGGMHRLIDIVMHKYLRELFDHRNDMLDAQEEMIKERAEHIECEKEKQELLKQLIELKQQMEQTE